MDVGDGAVVEAQQDVGVVLGVDLERADLPRVCEHLARTAEEPGQVVELVDRVEDDPAARGLPRAVALAVVRARPPERQIVAAVRARGERPSDAPLLDEPLHQNETRQESEVAADEDRAARPPGLLDERVGPLECVRQRLLDEDVPAPSQRSPGLVEVAVGRRADDGGVRVSGERVALVSRQPAAAADQRPDLIQARRVRIEDRRDLVAKGQEVLEMALADRAGADDDRTHRSRPPRRRRGWRPAPRACAPARRPCGDAGACSGRPARSRPTRRGR